MPEISIIVPVYRVEKYLDRCVQSILNQTFTDFELILVDDGSPDNCPQMCDEWAKKDERIRVIHKKNGGLSSARNAGLDVAKGKYIGFIDSDDWIANDMFQTLYELILKYDADYAAVEMAIVKSEDSIYKQSDEQVRILNEEELFSMFFRVLDENIHYCVCDKLFKSEKIKQVRFTEGIRFEDIDYIFRVLQNCVRGVHTDKIKYFWFYNDSSITRNGIVQADMQLLEVWEKIVNICKLELPQYEYYARMNYERAYMGILGKSVKFGVSNSYENWKYDKKFLLKGLRKYFKDLICWKMSFSRKCLLCALCINPTIVSIPFAIRRMV